MEHEYILWDNDQNADKLISKILTAVSLIILCMMILTSKGIIHAEYQSQASYYWILGICMIIFLLPTIIIEILGICKPWVRYMVCSCTTIVTVTIMNYFSLYSFFMIIVPITLTALYFDQKLELYSILLVCISIMVGVIAKAMILHGQFSLEYFIERIEGARYFVIGTVLFVAFCFILLSLTKRSSRLLDKAYENSGELKRNRDGLDVIVDNTDILFRARSYGDIISIILFLIQDLFQAIEEASCDLKGYVGIKDNEGQYYGITQALKHCTFEMAEDEVVIRMEDGEYRIPVKETEESSTVFVSKDKLYMQFYVDQKLFAFVAMRMNLNGTDEVLNKLVRVLYRNIHLALNNIKLSNDMYQTQEEIVRAFSEISESKSGQTGKHIKRVSEYMKIMAEALDLEQSEKDSLVIASMMHDIGKLLIPESILEKPGKLTASEFEIMKTHVKLGYKLLEYSPGRIMEIARVIALQHHEKWDGTGYLGMKGQEIDYYSRIMAVVDVFDALMSKRSYKERWSTEDAYNEIVSQSGKHFDPQVVQLFIEHFDEFLEVLKNYPDTNQSAS